jgi:hypothetical protein
MASAQIVQQGKALYAYTGEEWIPLNGGNSLVNATRWQKTLSASASLFSGDDDFGDPLIYTPEYEQLYLNGILLARNIDYTAENGLTIELNTPANDGDIVEILALNNISVANTYTKNQIDTKIADTFNKWVKTLSASATVLSGEDNDSNILSYTPGLEKVYVNGILLAPEEYTATSGSSVILDEAGVENDIIQIQTFKNFRIANHYTINQTDDKFLSKNSASGTYAIIENTYTQTEVNNLLTNEFPLVAFSVYRNGTQSISASTSTKVQFNVEDFDTNNNFDSTTNYRFTPTVAGYYQVSAFIRFTSVSTAQVCNAQIHKNGSTYFSGNQQTADSFGQSDRFVGGLLYLNGTTDYVEVFVSHTDSVSRNVASGSTVSWFNGILVRKA